MNLRTSRTDKGRRVVVQGRVEWGASLMALGLATAAALTASSCASINTGETIRFKQGVAEAPLAAFADLTYESEENDNAVVFVPGAFHLLNLDWFARLIPGMRNAIELRHEFDSYCFERFGRQPEDIAGLLNASVVTRDARRDAEINQFSGVLDGIYRDRSLSDFELKGELVENILDYGRSEGRLNPLLETRAFEDTLASGPFWFYPQIDVDFSATLNVLSDDTTLSDVGLVIVLDEDARATTRIIDFTPKSANVSETRRGNHEESSRVAAQWSGGDTANDTTTIQNDDSTVTTTIRDDNQFQRGSDAWYTERYNMDVMAIQEAVATGLLRNGGGFYARHQSRGLRRVSGTHSYSLLLKVAGRKVPCNSGVEGTFEWVPDLMGPVKARAYIVGVIRHRYRRGYSGITHRVPESTNDDVFEQVVLQRLDLGEVWDPSRSSVEAPRVRLTVVTNSDDGQFVFGVREGEGEASTFRALGRGSGKSQSYSLPLAETGLNPRLEAEFLPAHILNGRNYYESFMPAKTETLVETPNERYVIVGTYLKE